jgi:hypothetical protein
VAAPAAKLIDSDSPNNITPLQPGYAWMIVAAIRQRLAMRHRTAAITVATAVIIVTCTLLMVAWQPEDATSILDAQKPTGEECFIHAKYLFLTSQCRQFGMETTF